MSTLIICICIAFIAGYILRALMDRANLPFYRDVHRLIALHPEYLDGIRQGEVHIKYRPGCAPKQRTVTMNMNGTEINQKIQPAVTGADA